MIRSGLVLAAAAFGLCACASDVLPSTSHETAGPFPTYEIAEIAYKVIQPGVTDTGKLRELGIDPRTTPNLQVLNYVEVMRFFMPTNAIAVALTGGNPASRSQANFDLSNNGTVANPLTNFKGSGVACSIFGSSTGVCNVTNNVMVANNTLASRCIAVGVDRTIGASDAPDITATISNNSVSGCDGNGIFTGALNSNGTAKIKVSNNTIAAPLTGVRPGIQVNSGTPSAAGTNTTVCLNISGNTSAGSGGTNGIGLRKEGTVSTTNAFGVQGMAATASPGIETFINGLNPAGNGTLLTSATSGFTNCSSAPAIAPPVDAEQPNANAAASGLLTRAWQWIASFFAA